MLTTIIAAFSAALLAILGKIVSARLAEPVLTALIVWALPRLAASTSNTLDDALARVVIEALQTTPQVEK